ncbi:MAG: hypothetical protein CVU38_18020 [Chloroflexi bacterium HGW-Chloroflexi-1]|nr:MAG: hypothetical protein CVU38_18020 [Chloroflexi bacterium HGW-Chloroflexi-1]
MFIRASHRLRGLNGLLLLALLSQLLSGSPIQMLELWCLELPGPCYQVVVRRWRRPLPLWETPAAYKGAWLIHWLVSTWRRWLPRCGLLLALLVWQRATCSPLAWGLLLGPLVEVLCLGLGFLCRTPHWRRRWWLLARGLNRGYVWTGLLVVGMSRSAAPTALRPDFAHQATVPLLLGSLLVPSRNETRQAETPQGEEEIAAGQPRSSRSGDSAESGLGWPVPCQVAVFLDESLPGEVLFCGGGAEVGWVLLVQDAETVYLVVQNVVVLGLSRTDHTGLRGLANLLVRQGWMSLEEVATVLQCSRRTVQRDQAAYAAAQDSACWVDRRRFNPGQRTAYRVLTHLGVLICRWVLNLLTDEPNQGRALEQQLAGLFDDRTIDRALEWLGLNAAEAAGVRQQVQDFVARVRQEAYWRGVAGEPLLGAPGPSQLLPAPAHPGCVARAGVTQAPGSVAAGVAEGSTAEPEEALRPLSEAGWEQQASDRATLSLATLHLVANGAYEAAQGLLAKREGLVSAVRAWHSLLTHLVASGGARLSQAKYQVWPALRGLLGGHLLGTSASFLRCWMMDVAEKAKETVTVQRSASQEETITRLQAYQEESVAQRVRRGLVKARAIWLDCYVNGVSRREAIVRAWHGTKHWAVKAFRRNIAQDVETGQVVTCPLSPSDVTPLRVLQQVVNIINGGLARAGAAYRLGRVTADRWWSVAEVLTWCLDEKLGFLCWAKAVKTVVDALETIDEEDPGWQEIKPETVDPDSGQVQRQAVAGVGYRLETEVTVYDLPEPVRVIVDWDGEPGGRKIARLAVGVAEATLGPEGMCDELRFRQRVEIVLKFLQRWLQLPNFGGGEAVARADERVCPSAAEALKKLATERKKTSSRLRNRRTRLAQVETELASLTADAEGQRPPSNSLGLGVQDLRSLVKRLLGQIERAEARLQELDALIAWGQGQGPAPKQETQYDLDLTREAILTQLKLDVFTAYQTLVDEFIELALKPVLREEAERQAAERQQLDKRSTAKGQEGAPLCTDVETLYQAKVANLERETILERLLNQPGRHLYHRGEHILVTVAQRFSDQRMQAAYERYCYIVNRKQIRVPMDEGEDWLLLFTYEKPSSSGDKFK